MKYSNIPLAQLTIAACKFFGIRRVVISPGSRNAPLSLSFLADDYFECFSVVDERAAAFFGLGMAQQDQNPVALVCTSGSALLNYYPAISEAYYSQIPLVVISADRPSYLIDKGYGQTIKQAGVFENHIAYSANLLQDASHAPDAYEAYTPQSNKHSQESIESHNTSEISKAFQALKTLERPIHLNVPFEEPLYGTTGILNKQWHFSEPIMKRLDVVEKRHIELWQRAKKIMVIVGVCPPFGDKALSRESIEFLASDPRVLVFTETTSNVFHEDFIDSIDNLLAPIESNNALQALYAGLKPDLLVSLGGAVVSKKIKGFLNCQRPAAHIQIGNDIVNNPFFTDFYPLHMRLNDFFNQLASHDITKTLHTDYKKQPLLLKTIYKQQLTAYCAQAPFSDLTAFAAVLASLPKDSLLQLANSATIRYAQLFSVAPQLPVFCNRGTSGIDGSTATAIGAAVASDKQTVCITGDLSFFYDSNALWNDRIPKNFRIILVNNQGGGIFRVLPGKSDSEEFMRYFETTHSLDASHLCAMHGLAYEKVSDYECLSNTLTSFFSRGEAPSLLEICTPRTINDQVLKDFFNSLSTRYQNQ